MDTDSEMETDTESVASSSASTVKGKPTKKAAAAAKPLEKLNTTGESLYEDAVSEQPKKLAPQKVPAEAPLSQQSDATFVSSTDQSATEQLEPRATYVVPKTTETISAAVVATDSDATFSVDGATSVSTENKTVVIATNRKGSATSIMTEDDSDSSASPVTNYKRAAEKIMNGGTKKNPNELFKYVNIVIEIKIRLFSSLFSTVLIQRKQ